MCDVSTLPPDKIRLVEADSYWCMSKLLDGIQVCFFFFLFYFLLFFSPFFSPLSLSSFLLSPSSFDSNTCTGPLYVCTTRAPEDGTQIKRTNRKNRRYTFPLSLPSYSPYFHLYLFLFFFSFFFFEYSRSIFSTSCAALGRTRCPVHPVRVPVDELPAHA